MNKLLLIASVFLSFSLSQAQTFKVVKIQGKKAIVEVSDPSLISVNQSYNVGDSAMPVSGSKGGRREHALGFIFSFLNQTSPTSSSILSLDGSYLWNMRSYEVGPLLGFSTSTGSSSTAFGAMGFYNFTENKPGVEALWALEGRLKVESQSPGGSATKIELGGNYRWFLLSNDHCLSASLLYYMSQTSGVSTSGIKMLAGISTYF